MITRQYLSIDPKKFVVNTYRLIKKKKKILVNTYRLTQKKEYLSIGPKKKKYWFRQYLSIDYRPTLTPITLKSVHSNAHNA